MTFTPLGFCLTASVGVTALTSLTLFFGLVLAASSCTSVDGLAAATGFFFGLAIVKYIGTGQVAGWQLIANRVNIKENDLIGINRGLQERLANGLSLF